MGVDFKTWESGRIFPNVLVYFLRTRDEATLKPESWAKNSVAHFPGGKSDFALANPIEKMRNIDYDFFPSFFHHWFPPDFLQLLGENKTTQKVQKIRPFFLSQISKQNVSHSWDFFDFVLSALICF